MIRDQLRHMARRWYLYAGLLLIWGLACVRLFYDHTPRLPILFNFTASLPYKVVVVDYSAGALARGDYVVFTFDGEGQRQMPGLRHQPFFKIVGGVAGDRVTVRMRHVYINGLDMGYAKTHTVTSIPLEPIRDTVIPEGYFYARGTGPDSFDSRYRSSGLVKKAQVIARVRPLF